MNYVDSFDLFGVPARQKACMPLPSAPTMETEGAVGDLCMDTSTGDIYKCTFADSGLYRWEKVDGGASTDSECNDCVKTVNGISPIENGNVQVSNDFTISFEEQDQAWLSTSTYEDLYASYTRSYTNREPLNIYVVNPLAGYECLVTAIEEPVERTSLLLRFEHGVLRWGQNGGIEKIAEPESGGDPAEGAVLYTEQKLTTDQQTQARANIGAAEAKYVYDYCGNLLPLDMVEDSYEKVGVAITYKDGVFTFNGTATTGTSVEMITKGTEFATIKAGQPYTIALRKLSGDQQPASALNIYLNSGSTGGTSYYQSNKDQFIKTVATDTILTRFAFNFAAGTVFTDYKVAPYLGQTFPENYTGITKRSVALASEESVEQLGQRLTPLEESVAQLKTGAIDYPAMFTVEKNRVIPIVQGINADLRLIAFADPHSTDANKYKKYNELLASGVIDCMVGLGDFNAYSTNTREKTLKYITQSLNHAGRTPDCLYLVGNHDIVFKSANSANVDPDTTLTKKEMHYCTCRHLEGAVNGNEADPHGCYYYVDYTGAKIRMIVLNTSDIYETDGSLAYKYTESVMIQQPQVDWLVNEALDFTDKTNPSEWSVLVFCHSAMFISDLLSKVLSAVKSGSNLNASSTLGNRRQLSDGTKQSVTLQAEKDFSAQGAIDVIGVLYGHDHNDVSAIKNGIQFIGFNCDNAQLDDYYVANVSDLTAGGYFVTAENGKTFCFDLTEEEASLAAKIGYNKYLQGNPQTTIRVQNSDGLSIQTGWSIKDASTEGRTEITGFVQERTPGTIAEESCMIVNIDKTAREIRIVPYGVGENRVISY